ncbi:biopolymer transporter ExbD [candidate division KSB1 bacterium]|nr:biopolymer transporter ExbD [candidate division KSB1 bacterium]NIR71730.1 biopolymer transporter ExbD [candidate division KSB1 bacterium]NIS26411.1 biopolymer transporter ExbD [candidate division KSB1 bacterium]NIT73170.1 biopolymer transporter ExbD [candidate division KSB1 bacterium]NIU27097.1 biopolymer transporter ExbD [candidate division KSB1 bacterium]
MDLRKSLGREERYQENNLNITPVLNIFLILVPFMLLTAVFVRISVLEFSLPSADNKSQQSTQPEDAVVTLIAINDKGFDLKTQGMKFSFINKKQDDFDFATLVEKLREVKRLHAKSEEIIIAPQASIKYNTIIKVMDRCRENGFPVISISG